VNQRSVSAGDIREEFLEMAREMQKAY